MTSFTPTLDDRTALAEPRARRWSLGLTMSVGLLALANLVAGWGMGVELLIRIHPEFPAMVPTTAVSLLVGSCGLIALSQLQNKWLGLACSLIIAATVCGTVMTQDFDHHQDAMSIGTALACLLVAGCLFTRSLPKREISTGLTMEAIGLSIVAIPALGYVFNAEALFGNPIYTQMALHTAIAFLMLFTAFLLYDSHVGWMRVISSPEFGSQMLRRLLPILIIAPVILTGLALAASQNNYLSADLRAAFLAYVMILLTVSAAVHFAHVTNLSEQRAAAAESLRLESERSRRAVEVALERGQKVEALGNLVGGVAHDFNNTLSVILGNLQLVQRDEDKDAHGRYLTDALDAVTQAGHLTQQLLAYGRKSRLEPVPAVLDELIPQTMRMFERLCPANILIKTQLEAADAVTQIDPMNFQQALLNILINAKDAQPEGGQIVVRTTRQTLGREAVAGFGSVEPLVAGTYIVVTVTDSGPGMTTQEMARATEPFFTTKPFGEGTGLGLSVSAGFCRQSGGGLTLSCPPGEGLTVTMALPLAGQQNVNSAHQEQQSAQQSVSQRRILLVDDDVNLTRVMARQLELDGNHVHVAANAVEALAVLEAGPTIDLVFADMVMPGVMQGHALAREIRQQFPATHVILMSGYDALRQHRQEAEHWDEPILQKPVNWELLREVTTSILSREKP